MRVTMKRLAAGLVLVACFCQSSVFAGWWPWRRNRRVVVEGGVALQGDGVAVGVALEPDNAVYVDDYDGDYVVESDGRRSRRHRRRDRRHRDRRHRDRRYRGDREIYYRR